MIQNSILNTSLLEFSSLQENYEGWKVGSSFFSPNSLSVRVNVLPYPRFFVNPHQFATVVSWCSRHALSSFYLCIPRTAILFIFIFYYILYYYYLFYIIFFLFIFYPRGFESTNQIVQDVFSKIFSFLFVPRYSELTHWPEILGPDKDTKGEGSVMFNFTLSHPHPP